VKARLIPLGEAWEGIDEAAELLLAGHVVAFPTDTVYGVGAHLLRAEALEGLFYAKGRPENRPLPVLVASPEEVYRLASRVPPEAEGLIRALFPGALTVVLPASSEIPPQVEAGTGSVGIRMPGSDVALELLRRCGGALATTSANRSGGPENNTAQAVMEDIGDRISAVLDGGMSPGGVPSTVVDVSSGAPTILRYGALPAEALRPFIKELRG
jgi:L-threonylcarbamoyladenylate synthase